jgi:putative restriction endonuclease
MTTTIQIPVRPAIEYPDSDGLPMSDNTRQFKWIGTIMWGLDAMFLDDPNVFVAGDLLWYPVEGEPTIRIGPDVLVAFNRPKGYRGSYKQWEEGNQAPQVIFETLSPGNRPDEMERKFQFYERYGVEEYYIYDPDDGSLEGWRRVGDHLEAIPQMAGFVSPLLGIVFDPGEGPDNLRIFRPDGILFLTASEWIQKSETERRRADEERLRADEERLRADEERLRADEERLRADEEHRRADEERLRADEEHRRADEERQRADEERLRADEERQRAEHLAARLRELGIDPE